MKIMGKNQQRKKAPSPLDRRCDAESPDTIDRKVLDTFPYEHAGRTVVLDIETHEFTAVCPWSGLPDFGTIRIHYTPRKLCIELRSLKYYLMSYRNVGIYQEHAVNRILEDLVKCSRPKWMEVIADYSIRGGIHMVARAEFGKK